MIICGLVVVSICDDIGMLERAAHLDFGMWEGQRNVIEYVCRASSLEDEDLMQSVPAESGLEIGPGPIED